jgi:hypothetical protein
LESSKKNQKDNGESSSCPSNDKKGKGKATEPAEEIEGELYPPVYEQPEDEQSTDDENAPYEERLAKARKDKQKAANTDESGETVPRAAPHEMLPVPRPFEQLQLMQDRDGRLRQRGWWSVFSWCLGVGHFF